ncbi:solute carrier family 22 member 6-like [Ixodes scapularis]|uniref:solute carrier family 22 member 6-like n=1 Tax=Ixodes scapularis TaxID=6945 RepID=UPI001A9EEFD1|nr:solute carrier family 22 member 6-like [Ixodes scapularis]
MASLKANKLANRNTELAKIRSESPRVPSTEEDIHVYGYGQFQRMALLCSIVSFFMNAVHSQTLLVMSRPVAHWCKPPDEYAGLSTGEWKNTSIFKDVDGRFSSCTHYEPPMPTPADNKTEVSCDRWNYDSEVGTTVVKDFSLVCDRKWLLRALRLVYLHSGSVLLPVMGSAADNCGRSAVLGLTLFGLALSGVVTSLVNTLFEFPVLQLLTSGSITTFQAISTVLLFEVAPQDRQMLFCMLNICVPLGLGTVVLGPKSRP